MDSGWRIMTSGSETFPHLTTLPHPPVLPHLLLPHAFVYLYYLPTAPPQDRSLWEWEEEEEGQDPSLPATTTCTHHALQNGRHGFFFPHKHLALHTPFYCMPSFIFLPHTPAFACLCLPAAGYMPALHFWDFLPAHALCLGFLPCIVP